MSLQKQPRDIYYLATSSGIKVYDLKNNFIGTTTGCTSIAHNGGQDGGSACLEDTDGSSFWIKSNAIFIHGMGLKLTDF